MKYLFSLLLLCITIGIAHAQKAYNLKSPDGKISLSINVGLVISWSVKHESTQVIAPSTVSLTLSTGEVLGKNVSVSSSKTSSVNNTISSPVYKKSQVQEQYNQLIINFKNNYGIIFRVYNDGAAYRFTANRKNELVISSEEATFNFDKDYNVFIPYVRDLRNHDSYMCSFEALYDVHKLSQFVKDTLAFLPLLVDLGDGKKVAIAEAHLESYPGMYILPNTANVNGFMGHFAKYPLQESNGGHNRLNAIVDKRADYIAKLNGVQNFPWRAIIISTSDKELANNDMIFKLASPNRLSDISWIKPGKVAWDWWNDWNISGVDFRAGINTETYKYYIDFASANKLEYIIMDEGWSDQRDLVKISPRINLQEIIDYGKQKNVGVILWATWYGVQQKMDEAFSKYASMGVKGFKIDFLDRNDEVMTASTYNIAKKAAEYKLLIDYHGVYAPDGLQRTYSNVINFEGVKGLENNKWTPADDVPRYDVTIPFIRMLGGSMDYTPGAMRNATKAGFRALNSMPMSQGTRAHQLAMYVVFEAPLQMLADNPTAYMKEQETTDFISKVPTSFDETIALDGKVGEYVAMARRKNNTWFVGAMTNWNPRELTLDFSFLGNGTYEAEIFKDGINADRDARDYKKELIKISSGDKIKINLMNGGGWAARLTKVN
jgi:alpha-glucosidase